MTVRFLHAHVRVLRHLRDLLLRRSVERLERVVAILLDRCGVVLEGDAPEPVVDRAKVLPGRLRTERLGVADLGVAAGEARAGAHDKKACPVHWPPPRLLQPVCHIMF